MAVSVNINSIGWHISVILFIFGSFWCAEKEAEHLNIVGVSQVEEVCERLLRPHHIHSCVRQLGTYRSLEGRTAQTYEISYCSRQYPLGPKKVPIFSIPMYDVALFQIVCREYSARIFKKVVFSLKTS